MVGSSGRTCRPRTIIGPVGGIARDRAAVARSDAGLIVARDRRIAVGLDLGLVADLGLNVVAHIAAGLAAQHHTDRVVPLHIGAVGRVDRGEIDRNHPRVIVSVYLGELAGEHRRPIARVRAGVTGDVHLRSTLNRHRDRPGIGQPQRSRLRRASMTRWSVAAARLGMVGSHLRAATGGIAVGGGGDNQCCEGVGMACGPLVPRAAVEA